MTPGGLGVVKFVFAAGVSLKRPASYTVALPHRRPGVVFHESELEHAATNPSIDFEGRPVARIQNNSTSLLLE